MEDVNTTFCYILLHFIICLSVVTSGGSLKQVLPDSWLLGQRIDNRSKRSQMTLFRMTQQCRLQRYALSGLTSGHILRIFNAPIIVQGFYFLMRFMRSLIIKRYNMGTFISIDRLYHTFILRVHMSHSIIHLILTICIPNYACAIIRQ